MYRRKNNLRKQTLFFSTYMCVILHKTMQNFQQLTELSVLTLIT